MKKQRVYLDYAATTPIDKDVLKAMQPYFFQKFGNASSIHSFGQEAAKAVEKSRDQLADFLGCEASEIVFTSGATESNNLAIKGVVKAAQLQGLKKGVKPHIITSQIEHPCILESCRAVEKQGLAEATYLPVNREGLVEVPKLEKALKDNTVLVSIMYVNNEIGTVQPIKEIGRLLKSKNKIFFHTDAVQAVSYFNCQVDKLGVDFLSLCAHKIYGPKGVGALYIRKNSPIKKIQDGGEHEFGMRAGSLNVSGIVGLGEAIKVMSNEKLVMRNNRRIKELRNKLIKGMLEKIPETTLNGSREQRVPNNANLSFKGAEGEAILMALDLAGVACSTASACASGKLKPSHVLIALGLGAEKAHNSIRFTLGKYTTKEDIDYVLKILPPIVERLRKISGKTPY